MKVKEKYEKRLLSYVENQSLSLEKTLIRIASYCTALFDVGELTMQERAELSAKYSQMATDRK